MSRLSDIPVRLESVGFPPAEVGLGGGVAAILSEIVGLLERLAVFDEAAMIDLRSLPVSDADRIELEQALGDGEVHATLRAEGLSTARETRFAGVWWIAHRDAGGELIAELLEVARFPQILSTSADEIASAAALLRTFNAAQADRRLQGGCR